MATLTVNTETSADTRADPDAMNLAEALDLARVSAEDDVIVFAAGVSRVALRERVYGADVGGGLVIDGDRDGDGAPDVTLVAEGAFGLYIIRSFAVEQSGPITLRGLRFADADLSGGHVGDARRAPDGQDGADGEAQSWQMGNLGQNVHDADGGERGLPGELAAPLLIERADVRLERVVFENNRAVAAAGGAGGDGGTGAGVEDAPFTNSTAGRDGGDAGRGADGGDGGSASGGFIATDAAVTLDHVAFGPNLVALAGDGGPGGIGGDGGPGGRGGEGDDGTFPLKQPDKGGKGGDGADGGFGGDGGDGGDAAAAFLLRGGALLRESPAAFARDASATAGAAGPSGRGGAGGAAGAGGPGGEAGLFQDPGPVGSAGAIGSTRTFLFGASDEEFDGLSSAGGLIVDGGAGRARTGGDAASLVFAHGLRTEAQEGRALVFSVTRLGDKSAEETLRWRLDGVSDDDVRGALKGRVTLEEGQTSARVRVKLVKDGLTEGDAGVDFVLNRGRLSDDAALGRKRIAARIEDLDGGTAGKDRLKGSKDDDLIDGLGARDVLRGRDGEDLIIGGGGGDRLFGGDGDDTLLGGDGADRLVGGPGDDFIAGEVGKDRIKGGGGDDDLYGGEGRDVIAGGRGDDLISGGAGRDVLSGGRGDDVFLLSERERARDVIRDFTRGEDELQLHRSGDAFTFLGEQAFDGTENAIRAEARGDGCWSRSTTMATDARTPRLA